MRASLIRSVALASALAVTGLAMVACTTTKPGTESAPRMDSTTLNTRADATLDRLYSTAPGSKELVARASGVLIFPSVVGGSFIVGAEHGRGVLRTGGKNHSYYSTTVGSVGWQIGAQSKAVVYVFNTPEALNKFVTSNGWAGGVDATVAVGKVGANGAIDTTSAQAPVVSFVLTNVGLEAGVSVQGSKISKIVM